MRSEVTKKLKMKMKAAKVLKFLINFLQVKPKKKHRGQEKLCIGSCVHHDSSKFDAVEFHPLLPNPIQDVPCHALTDNRLSLSWSYLVHDPFISNLNGYVPTDMDNGEIFYNESYFEDDYWQDYHEHDVPPRSPARCGIQNLKPCSHRLFEPGRTPCGEFKRNSIVPEAARKRHASLPNFVGDEHVLKSLAKSQGLDQESSSELLDYNRLPFSRPQFGLNIAFDSLLDETDVYNLSLVQSLSTQEMNTEQFVEYDQSIVHQSLSNVTSQWTETVKTSHSHYNKRVNSNMISQMFEVAVEPSECIIETSSEILVSDSSGTIPDERLGCRACVSSDHCTLGMFESVSQERHPSITAEWMTCISGNAITKNRPPGSLESGCSSSGRGSLASSLWNPDLESQADISVSAVTSTDTGMPTDAYLVTDESDRLGIKSFPVDPQVEATARVHHSPNVLSNNAWTTERTTQTNTVMSTSSPMQVNTSLKNKRVVTPIADFLSPIKPDYGNLKCRLRAVDHNSGLKNGYVSANMHLSYREPLVGDYHLLTMAAGFIVNKIEWQKEMEACMNFVELVEYLNSYYMSEIWKLSNKNVQTVTDYKRASREALDTFTLDRLTQTNCFCQLLMAILGNRSRVVSACQDYICENLHYFVNTTDYLEAPPELVLMLLCHGSMTLGVPPAGQELFVKRALINYLQSHRASRRKYSRVKRMFSFAFGQRPGIHLGHNMTSEISESRSALFADVETEIDTTIREVDAGYGKWVSAHLDSGFLNGTSSPGVKLSSRVQPSVVDNRTRPSCQERSTFNGRRKQSCEHWSALAI